MKKNRFRKAAVLLLGAVLCIGLTGCGKSKDKEPEKTDYIGNVTQDTITLYGDGSIIEIACEDYSGVAFDYSDLEQYIKDEVADYNSRAGQDKITFLQYSDEGGVVRTALQYSDMDTYNDFNKTSYWITDYDAALCDELAQAKIKADRKDSETSGGTEGELSAMSEEELAEIGLSAEDLEKEEVVETISEETVLATFTDAASGSEISSAQIQEASDAGTPYKMIRIDSKLYFSLPDGEILYMNSHAAASDPQNAHTDGIGEAIIIYSNY